MGSRVPVAGQAFVNLRDAAPGVGPGGRGGVISRSASGSAATATGDGAPLWVGAR